MLLLHKISKEDLKYKNDIIDCIFHNTSNILISKILIISDVDGLDSILKIDPKSKKLILLKVDFNHFDMIKYAKKVADDYVIYSTPFIKFNSDISSIKDMVKSFRDIIKSEYSYYIFSKSVIIKESNTINNILVGNKKEHMFSVSKFGYYRVFNIDLKSIGWEVSESSDSIIRSTQNISEEKEKVDIKFDSVDIKTIKFDSVDIKTTKTSKRKLDLVIVSVNYNDLLLITLESNSKFFNNITVVTSPDDLLCRKICDKFGANCVVTNAMYDGGAVFNKGKAINEGIRSIKDPDYILLIDADIIVSSSLNVDVLEEDVLYSMDRIILPDYDSYINYLKTGSLDGIRRDEENGIGYFQLFNYKHKQSYPEISTDAAWSDLIFRDKFIKRKKIEGFVSHLGIDCLNWKGRITERFLTDEKLTEIFKEENVKFNLNTYFDNIYCLNLDRRKDRWRKVKIQFDREGILVQRFSAIDGNCIDFLEGGSSDLGLIENSAAMACLISHLEIIKDAKSKGYKKILIFEDDIFLSDDFGKSIKSISSIDDWKIIYLGASQFSWNGIKIEDGFYKSKNTLGTFAYALHESAYDRIIEIFNGKKKSVDNLLAEYQSEAKCVTMFPNIVISDVSDSDIRNSKDLMEYSKGMRWDLNMFSLNPIKKIAFLFLTVSGLKKVSEWNNFFTNVDKDYYSIYSHSSYETGQDLIDKNSISLRIKTKWADISIVDATNLLIEEALKDRNNYYIVLLSESCVPIYSFDFIYEKICDSDKSWIYYYKWKHIHNEHRYAKMSVKSSKIEIDRFYKQSQFMIMKRSHAEVLMNKKDLYDFSKVNVPDEHYYINILKNEISTFDDENICFPATNIYRLSGKTDGYTNPIDSLVIYDVPDCRNDFEQAEQVVNDESISLFFRKVSENTDIIRSQCKKMNSEIAVLNLYRISEILKSNGVTHWITDGTLLGAIREGGFISHDTDTDIGVLFSTFSKDAYDSLINAGFSIRHIFGYPEDSLEISLERDGVKTDLFFFYEEDGKLRHSAFSDISKKGYYRVDYSYDKFSVSERLFMGRMFYMPEDPMIFIVTKYGEDWNVPNRNWNWATSPLNAVQTGIYIYRDESMLRFNYWLTQQKIGKITLLIKSFMRRDCVERLISSIRNRYPDIPILVIDDSHPKMIFEGYNIQSVNIEFDSGLSKGRNYGVSLIETPYFVLLDDDFLFTDDTDLVKFLEILEKSGLDLLGGQVLEKGKYLNYFGCFEYDDINKVLSTKPKVEDKGLFKKCDLVLNFFIAKTEKIRKFGWDDDLKLAEHTAFFYDNRGKIGVGYTEKISIIHDKKRDDDYLKFRNRGSYFFNKWLYKKGIEKYINIKGESHKICIEGIKNVVITYGTFDTFHYGHLEILKRAKSLGDYLIVGLSTDRFNSIKGKKSNFKYEKRKEWLESIRFVDLVIPEDSWEQKEIDIAIYSVDKLVMGDDWKGKFDYLKCEVVYLERTKGISSSQIKKFKKC